MKKITRIAALLAATALLLGAFGCSSGGGSGNSDDNSDDDDQELEGDYTGPATTDSWNFVNNTTVFGIITGATDTKAADEITYKLSEDADIKGSEGNLTLTLQSTKVSIGSMKSDAEPNYAVQAKKEDTASAGLRFKNNSIKISDVKGKVVLEFDYTAAGDSPRNLQVTIGDNGTTKTYSTADKVEHTYSQEINAGSGTNIYIGGDNNYWIKAISITENTAAFGTTTDTTTANNLVTLGLIGATATSSDETVATVKIEEGKVKITSVKAGEAVITVKNSAGKEARIPVTVKSSGEIEIGTIVKFTRSAPISADKTNANSQTGAKGSVKVTGDGLTDLEYSLDGETFVDADTAQITATVADATVSVTELAIGTYYVRGAASAEYEVTPTLIISIGDDGAEKKSYTLEGSDISDIGSGSSGDYEYTEAYKDFFYLSKSGVSYDASKGIKINGSLQKQKNHIRFTTTGTTTITVIFTQSSSDTEARHAQYATISGKGSDGDNKATLGTPVTGTEGALKGGEDQTTVFEGLTAGEYAVGGDSGIYVSKLIVEVVQE